MAKSFRLEWMKFGVTTQGNLPQNVACLVVIDPINHPFSKTLVQKMHLPIISEAFEDLLLYRMYRLTSVAGAMVVRLCEGGYGITRREGRILALLQAINRNILAGLSDTQAVQFNASLERLQASAQALP